MELLIQHQPNPRPNVSARTFDSRVCNTYTTLADPSTALETLFQWEESGQMADLSSLLLAAAFGGGGPKQPAPALELPAFFNCGGKETQAEEKFVNAPPPRQGPLFLRLCILCGNDLAAGDNSAPCI